jgi:bifunctional DNA-binding transcriptional regulator/antitoxin component of YhaV-PrlF toxin-antitoxin module
MGQRRLQQSTKRHRTADGARVLRESSTYTLTIPTTFVEALRWAKGTRVEIALTVDKGAPALILKEASDE